VSNGGAVARIYGPLDFPDRHYNVRSRSSETLKLEQVCLICAQTRELGPEAGIEVKVLLFSTEYLFNGGGKLGIHFDSVNQC
jgi:hypothetical protein